MILSSSLGAGGGGGKRDLHHSSRREAIVAKNVDSSRHSFRMYSKVEDVVAEVMSNDLSPVSAYVRKNKPGWRRGIDVMSKYDRKDVVGEYLNHHYIHRLL